EMARTPLSMLAAVPGSGLGTTVQDAPSQCSVRVWFTPPLDPQPTAQASHGDSTLVAARRLFDVRGLAAKVPDQVTQVAAEAVAVPRQVSNPASVTGTKSSRGQRMARKFQSAGKVPRMRGTVVRPAGRPQYWKTPTISGRFACWKAWSRGAATQV